MGNIQHIPRPGEYKSIPDLLKTTLSLPGVDNCYIVDNRPELVGAYYGYEKGDPIFGFRKEDNLLVEFRDSSVAAKYLSVDVNLMDEGLREEQDEYYTWDGWYLQSSNAVDNLR